MDRCIHDVPLGDIRARKFLDNLALSGNQNSIGKRHYLGEIGRNHHNRFAFVGQSPDNLMNFGYSTDINPTRSEEHTSELQSLMSISYAVFCLKKKNTYKN